MVQFSKGWRIYSALRKAKQQTRTLSKWNRTGYRNTMQPRQLKREVVRQLKQQILCHLIFINSGEQITPQLPSNRNQKCDLIGLGSHYGVRTCTKILVPRTTHSRFPPKKIQLDLRLWLIRESTGRVQPPWIWVKPSQMVVGLRGGDSPGSAMLQPVLPCEHTTNVMCG